MPRNSSHAQQATFTAIFQARAWGDGESVSGPGSSRARGDDFRDDLLALLDTWQIRSIVDLLATTFIDRGENEDVITGGWRVLNLQAAPFHLPAPLALVDERCTHTDGIYRDKRLGLWSLD